MKKKVLVLGSVNNLTTMYAKDMAKNGADVILVSGFLKRHVLHDPESYLINQEDCKSLKLKRIPFFNNFLLPFFTFLYFLLMKLLFMREWSPDVVVFNDSYITFSKLFPREYKVFLPHGGDIETWCGFAGGDDLQLANSMKKGSIFKYIPSALIRMKVVKFIRKKYKAGLEDSNLVIYFPETFTNVTKKIKRYCEDKGIEYWERYDLALNPVEKYTAKDKNSRKNDAFEVIVPVRFAFKTFGEGNKVFNKSNDLILLGIEEFLKQHPNEKISVTLFEKGIDIEEAKKIVENSHFLAKQAVWIKPVDLYELMNKIFESDFCFDGVGEHWPGAIAAYSLCLGVPTGANFEKVRSILPKKIDHLYDVRNAKQVTDALNDAFINKEGRYIKQKVLDELRSSYSTEKLARQILNKL